MISLASSESIRAAFDSLLSSLGIPTDDTAIFNETQNDPFRKCEESKADYVADIDHLTSSLSTISETIVHILSTRIANLNKCRNLAVSPMHQLPAELFNDVIFHSIPDPMKYAYFEDLQGIRIVCTRWASQILSNKTLWAFIWDHPISGLRMNSHQVEQLLKRSGSAPLSIRFGPNSLDLIPTVFPLLIYQTHRIKSIWVEIYHPQFDTLLSNAMPMLESLHLWAHRDERPVLNMNFLGLYAPRLRILVTSYLSTLMSADPSILAGLEELSIIHPSDAERADDEASTIMTTATACPALKSLRIRYYLPDSSIPVPLHLPDTYALPHLESLDLAGSPYPLCAFLKAIVAPKCKSYKVDTGRFDVTQEDQLQLLLQTCSSFLNDENGVILKLVKDDFREYLLVQPYSGENSPRLSIVTANVHFGLVRLLSIIATMGILKVIRIETPFNPTYSLRTPAGFVTDVPCVEELAIGSGYCGEEVTLAILVQIARAYRQRPDSTPPPLAQLRTLEIWEEGGWVNKFDEVMAALALEEIPMDAT